MLRGNLCPDGAVIKQSAASPHLMSYRGRAAVFAGIEAYERWADSGDLTVDGMPVDEGTVLVLQNAGPRGYPGMPRSATW